MRVKRTTTRKSHEPIFSRIKILQYFILPYLFFLLLLLTIGGVFYYATFDVIYEETAGNIREEMDQNVSIQESRMEEIDNIIKRLSISRYVRQLKNIEDPYDSNNIALILNALNDMESIGYANKFIEDFYIIYFGKNVVLGNGGAHTIDRFLEGGVSLSGYSDLSFLSKYQYTYHILPEAYYTYHNEREVRIIPYVHTLPSPRENRVVIVMLLNADKVEELFRAITADGGSLGIFDQANKKIFQSGPMEITNQDAHGSDKQSFVSGPDKSPFIRTFTRGKNKKYIYISMVPEQNIFETVKSLKRILILFFGLIFFTGLSAAAFIAMRRSRSLTPVLLDTYSLDTEKSEKDLFKRIADKFDSISERGENQALMLQNAFVRNLISGVFNYDSEIEAVINKMNLYLQGDFFMVIIVQYTEAHLIEKETIHIDEIVPELAETLHSQTGFNLLHTADSFKGTLIIPGKGDGEAFEEKCSRIINAFARENSFALHSIKTAMGQSYESLKNISLSYQEAMLVMETRKVNEEIQEISYRKLKPSGDSIYYPMAMEQNLVNLTLSCHKEEALALMEEIIQKNRTQEHRDSKSDYMLFQVLKSTQLRIINQAFPTEEQRQELLSELEYNSLNMNRAEESFQGLLGFHGIILDSLGSTKVSKSEKMVQNAKEYILENYRDPLFGIPMISEKFSISEFHFSREFKKVTGSGFNTFLEDARLSKAKELLVDGNHSIKQIAFECGYSSSNTFCRAFKRRNGITAGEFKNSRL